jgi:stearoyl-CoA desaturase (delta-9 desaturase)
MRDSLLSWFDNSHAVDACSDPDRVDWLRIVPFVALHAGALAAFWVGASAIAVAVAATAYVVRMFAVTAFYHRYFSHRAFRTSRGVQFVGALLGASATQRGPLWWAGVHRQHHRSADAEGDPHAPREGLLRAHLGWFLTRRHFSVDPKLTADWRRFPELVWLDRFDVLVPMAMASAMYLLGAWLERVLPAAGTNGLQMLVWGYCISTVALTHATCCVNSIAHRFGTRRYDTRDASRNNRWLAFATLGEGWHNNHHRYACAARQGFFPGELDVTYAALRLLEKLRLVWELREVPQAVLAEGRTR